MSNPGPNERMNNTCSDNVFGETRTVGIVGREYILTEAVPKNTQLIQFYGHTWFSTRGMKRLDVDNKKHPAPQRRNNKKKQEKKSKKRKRSVTSTKKSP
jgi:hypothetical protein